MQKLAIIVAGGSGSRMGSSVPKQFLPLAGRPILMHTIQLFADVPDCRVVVVLPDSQVDFWRQLCSSHSFTTTHEVVTGGSTRHASVSNGLALLRDEPLVAVHDGVRPLVDPLTIVRCFDEAAQFGSAIPVMPATESVRIVSGNGSSHAVDRNDVMLVQTPQVFRSDVITKAYSLPYSPLFTDDASVVEAAGFSVHLAQGNIENIKVTRPADMIFAEALFAAQSKK